MIKRYFIVVLLLSLLPAGVSAQRRAAAKKRLENEIRLCGCSARRTYSRTPGRRGQQSPYGPFLYGRLFRLYGDLRYGGHPAHLRLCR